MYHNPRLPEPKHKVIDISIFTFSQIIFLLAALFFQVHLDQVLNIPSLLVQADSEDKI